MPFMLSECFHLRWPIWKEVLWQPWLWVVTSVYGVLQLYQLVKGELLTQEIQDKWRLPNILPDLPWRTWVIVWLVLFLVIVLEGAYRAIGRRDHELKDLKAELEPTLEVVFDPDCEVCWDESGTQVRMGIWNRGRTAEDVHVYLSSVTPGPNLGKLELAWSGEGRVGRQINSSIRSGHHHFDFMWSAVKGPFELAVQGYTGLLGPRSYVTRVLVEASNMRPLVAEVAINPKVEPPIQSVLSTPAS
jgi:hypothetical protein